MHSIYKIILFRLDKGRNSEILLSSANLLLTINSNDGINHDPKELVNTDHSSFVMDFR